MKTVNTMEKLLLAMVLVFTLGACGSKTKHQDANTSVEQNTTVADDNTSTGGHDNNTTAGGGGNDDNATTGNDDNTTTGGEDNTTTTPTVTLASLKLTVGKTSLNKDENTTVKAIATYSDNTTKEVTDKVEWVIVPSDAVKVTQSTLTALKDKATTVKVKLANKTSDGVSLNITWIVNGHVLPPEPDPKVNNATLLGVDVNDNGVRDDVERWIYRTYDQPIERGIFMQSAMAYQKVIVDPSKAHETTKYIDDAYSCRKYWFTHNKELYDKYEYVYPSKRISKIQFNTLKRYIAYERFNGEFNGEVFGSPEASKDKCEFDENGILKALK